MMVLHTFSKFTARLVTCKVIVILVAICLTILQRVCIASSLVDHCTHAQSCWITVSVVHVGLTAKVGFQKKVPSKVAGLRPCQRQVLVLLVVFQPVWRL